MKVSGLLFGFCRAGPPAPPAAVAFAPPLVRRVAVRAEKAAGLASSRGTLSFSEKAELTPLGAPTRHVATHDRGDRTALPSRPRPPPPPPPPPPREQTEGYSFPVGRALRYVRQGRHYFRRHDVQHHLRELIQRCQSIGAADGNSSSGGGGGVAGGPFPVALLSGGRAGDRRGVRRVDALSLFLEEEGHEDDDAEWGWHEGARDASEPDEQPLLDKVQRFTNYHCHHVKVAYKARRGTWTRRTQGTGTSNRQRLLAVEETNEILSFLFQASLLLHLTALFGVSEPYLESLLSVCLSCSIFLSQQHNRWRHAQAERHPRDSGVLMSGRLPLSPPLAILKGNQRGRRREAGEARGEDGGGATAQVNSLHWAVVHYCEGVRLWGLLQHTEPLFPMLQQGGANTTTVFAKLLQAHAGLLLSLSMTSLPSSSSSPSPLPIHARPKVTSRRPSSSPASAASRLPNTTATFSREGDSARYTQHYLQQLLGGAAAQKRTGAIATWLGRDPLYTQQRCLQLLPLLWLSMLLHHLTYTEAAHAAPPPPVSARAARHAFLRLIPLFSAEVGREHTFWAMASLLYAGSSGGAAAAGASHVEVAAMLSTMEHSSGDAVDERERTVLLAWLSRWREVWQHEKHSQQQSLSLPLASTGPSIRTARQLYRALLNIPLSCCDEAPRSSSSSSSSPGSSTSQLAHRQPPPSTSLADDDIVTVFFGDRGNPSGPPKQVPFTGTQTVPEEMAVHNGLAFMNELLFRTLLQWRSAQLPDFIPAMVGDAGTEEAPDAQSPEGKRMLSYSSYMEELAMVLSTVLHLAELHRRLACLQRSGSAGTADLARAVSLSVEAAMRALGGQLGDNVFPARRQGLAWSRRKQQQQQQRRADDTAATVAADEPKAVTAVVAVSQTERQLLEAIHACVTTVLVGGTAALTRTTTTGEEEDEEDLGFVADGRVPERYLHGMRLLLAASTSAS